MDIVSALFIESFDLRQVPGAVDPRGPRGASCSRCRHQSRPRSPSRLTSSCSSARDATTPLTAILEVVFRDEAGEQVARNVSPFNVEPGKFTYRLVRGELEYPNSGRWRPIAACVPDGQTTIVPLTLLAPLPSAQAPGRGRARRRSRGPFARREPYEHRRNLTSSLIVGGHGARAAGRDLQAGRIYVSANWSRRRGDRR